MADGRIVDPSILLLVSATTPVFYFAGVARSWAEAEALEGAFFPQVRFDGVHGKDGLGHPGYKAARAAARRKVYALALSEHPLKAMQFLTAQDLAQASPQDEKESMVPPTVEREPLNRSLSLTTAHYLQAIPGRCWQNAREALLRMPYVFLSALYVEGWLVGQWHDAIHVTEHGWVWTPRVGIVDPTLVLKAVPKRLAYFPGFQLSWPELQTYTTCPLPLTRQRNMGVMAYQESCRMALERGEQLAWETGLPLRPEPGGVTTVRSMGDATLSVETVRWDFPVPATPSPRVAALLRELD